VGWDGEGRLTGEVNMHLTGESTSATPRGVPCHRMVPGNHIGFPTARSVLDEKRVGLYVDETTREQSMLRRAHEGSMELDWSMKQLDDMPSDTVIEGKLGGGEDGMGHTKRVFTNLNAGGNATGRFVAFDMGEGRVGYAERSGVGRAAKGEDAQFMYEKFVHDNNNVHQGGGGGGDEGGECDEEEWSEEEAPVMHVPRWQRPTHNSNRRVHAPRDASPSTGSTTSRGSSSSSSSSSSRRVSSCSSSSSSSSSSMAGRGQSIAVSIRHDGRKKPKEYPGSYVQVVYSVSTVLPLLTLAPTCRATPAIAELSPWTTPSARPSLRQCPPRSASRCSTSYTALIIHCTPYSLYSPYIQLSLFGDALLLSFRRVCTEGGAAPTIGLDRAGVLQAFITSGMPLRPADLQAVVTDIMQVQSNSILCTVLMDGYHAGRWGQPHHLRRAQAVRAQ
jgi:hypothetical protein